MSELSAIDLNANKLEELPRGIGTLNNLTSNLVASIGITSQPQELLDLTNLRELNLRDNLLPTPPEILEKKSVNL